MPQQIARPIIGKYSFTSLGMKCLLAALLFLFGSSEASTHEWYPAECCSGRDCGVVLKKIKTPAGTWVYIERGAAFFHNGFLIRASPDGQEHACMSSMDFEPAKRDGHYPVMHPRCWFQPAIS